MLTVEQARKRAKELYLDTLNGIDPMGHKQKRREAITVGELLTRYTESPKFALKAATTRAVDGGRIERHLRPLLGSVVADMVTADDVRRARLAIAEGKTAGRVKTGARGLAKVTGGAGTADQSVTLLRSAYSWTISEGLLTDNPAAGVKVAQSGQRDVILGGADDYAQLFRTLAKMENEFRIRRPAADAIRLIALTGARRGEAAGLKWQFVDLRAGQIVLPPTAHKAAGRTGKPRIISLPAEAQAIIARQPAGEADDFVFKPARGAGPLTLAKPWQQVRTEAGFPENLGLHGLRHSLASHLAMAGASSAELMEALVSRPINYET